MQRIILLALIACLSFSCANKEEPEYYEPYNAEQQHIDDIATIESFLAINQLEDFLRTESGVFYKILEEGEEGGDHPDINSTVRCDYVGNLLDEERTVFDGSNDVEFKLNEVIRGWQDGIPKLKRQGRGVFFIPSTLAYGNQEIGADIGRNEILQFEVFLHDFWD